MAVFAVTQGNICGPRKLWHCTGGALDHFFKTQIEITNAADRAASFLLIGHSLSLKRL
jgi:hypothetical protein